MKTWIEDNGQLPIAIEDIKEKPKAKSKGESGMPSSSSNAPKAKTTGEDGTIDEEPDQDIPQYQKPPVVVPSRVNITILRETLVTAYLEKKNKNSKDLKIYHEYIDLLGGRKIKSEVRQHARKELTHLYSKYVYGPAREKANLERKAKSKTVKKSNIKDQN